MCYIELQCFRFCNYVVNCADIEKCLLRICVHFAAYDSAEALDGICQLYIYTRQTCKLLGYVCRLRQESLNLTRSVDCQLVFVRELIHTEDRDDILEFCILLQYFLHSSCYIVVLVANDIRFKDT